jgi:hypothetical protein
MPSSEMLHNVALVRTGVSEERITSIIRVTRIGQLGTTLAVTSHQSTLLRSVEAIHSSETSVLTRTTLHIIPEDGILHSHRSENLKSYRER